MIDASVRNGRITHVKAVSSLLEEYYEIKAEFFIQEKSGYNEIEEKGDVRCYGE